MLTNTDLSILRDFLRYPDDYTDIYGAATLPRGTLIINSRGIKPVDYFLIEDRVNGPNMNGVPFTEYRDIILTKKHRDSGIIQTIILPKKSTK